jgi:glycosyltransferase involved in cell wall biosynthesis
MRRASGAPTVIFVVDFLLDAYADKHRWLKPFVKVVTTLDAASWRAAALVFTRTLHGQSILQKHRVPQDRLRTVYDACDMSLYCPADRAEARRRYGYDEDEVVLSHHGVLHPNKGMDRIITALAHLMDAHDNLRFLCIGSGPEEDALRAMTERLGIADRVRFTGWLATARDVNVALNASDIGLVMRVGLPADHFHVTGALVHSMAVGLPTLAPRLAGIQEVVTDGAAGFLFDPADMGEFTERCGELVEDKALRTRLGNAALALAREKFDVERAADTVVQALLETLCKR